MLRRAMVVASMAVLISGPISASSYSVNYQREGTIIGRQWSYLVKTDESLPEIARRYDLGYGAITAANPGVDPFIPRPGLRIVLPTEWILPDAPIRNGIVVNIAEMRLFVFSQDRPEIVTTFPIGIGDQGKETPVGTFTVIEKTRNPAWYVPESIRKEQPDLPAVVPPGPDNPMGSHALRLSKRNVLIHGTNRPWGIGARVSHGCIRLYQEDIAQLFGMIRPRQRGRGGSLRRGTEGAGSEKPDGPGRSQENEGGEPGAERPPDGRHEIADPLKNNHFYLSRFPNPRRVMRI